MTPASRFFLVACAVVIVLVVSALPAAPPELRRFAAQQLDIKGKAYPWAVFAYRIRAINRLGIESGPSPYFLTFPSAPTWLFSREQGAKGDLK